MNIHEVILRPLMTEKGNIGREMENLATFAVDTRANKHEIRRAVEGLFNVSVVEVRTMRQPRKKRRLGKHVGYRSEWKKAIVQLAEGQTIEFFEGL